MAQLTACHGYPTRRQEVHVVFLSECLNLWRLQACHREHANLGKARQLFWNRPQE